MTSPHRAACPAAAPCRQTGLALHPSIPGAFKQRRCIPCIIRHILTIILLPACSSRVPTALPSIPSVSSEAHRQPTVYPLASFQNPHTSCMGLALCSCKPPAMTTTGHHGLKIAARRTITNGENDDDASLTLLLKAKTHGPCPEADRRTTKRCASQARRSDGQRTASRCVPQIQTVSSGEFTALVFAELTRTIYF